MYVKGLFEVYKILQRLGIKPKDIIGMGGDVVKMGKSLFNTRINPKLLQFVEKNQKIPTKILEEVKLHARTLKNASESQKNLFQANIKDLLNAKTPKPPVTSVQRPATSVKEQATEVFKGWTPKVIKGGKDKLATGGRVKFQSGSGLKLSPIVSLSQTQETVGQDENINVDVDERTYGLAGIYEGDNWYGGGEYLKGNVKVDVTQEGETLFKDTMSKDDMMQLYVGLGEREGNHVEIGTDGEGNYTLNIIKSFAKGGIANHFRKK
jgi:hydroxymethylpyrimidine pyrophosphatase-like HAD family hydrolase